MRNDLGWQLLQLPQTTEIDAIFSKKQKIWSVAGGPAVVPPLKV
jgi:hypothetical protein